MREVSRYFNKIVQFCDARHGTEISGESPPRAELKRFTSLDKGKFARACHEGSGWQNKGVTNRHPVAGRCGWVAWHQTEYPAFRRERIAVNSV